MYGLFQDLKFCRKKFTGVDVMMKSITNELGDSLKIVSFFFLIKLLYLTFQGVGINWVIFSLCYAMSAKFVSILIFFFQFSNVNQQWKTLRPYKLS